MVAPRKGTLADPTHALVPTVDDAQSILRAIDGTSPGRAIEIVLQTAIGRPC